jgi:hypothetical protein
LLFNLVVGICQRSLQRFGTQFFSQLNDINARLVLFEKSVRLGVPRQHPLHLRPERRIVRTSLFQICPALLRRHRQRGAKGLFAQIGGFVHDADPIYPGLRN